VQKTVQTCDYSTLVELTAHELRPVAVLDAKIEVLREYISASIERGGSHTDDEVEAAIARRLEQLVL
jgi:hypothetical protein